MFEDHAQDSRVREMPDVSPTQGAQLCNAPANNPLVATGLDLYNWAETGGVAMTVRAAAGHADTTPTIAVRTAQTGANGCGISAEAAHTLDRAEGQAVACGINCNASLVFGVLPETAQTLTVCHRGGVADTSNRGGVEGDAGCEYVVRRLTPRECERLQGFPDDWTRIPYRGKPAEECPDGPRYKAMGNSWGTNCAEWILRRILAARPVWNPETSTETKGRNESQC